MKKCKICENPFESKTNGKYCSDQCKKDSLIAGYHKRLKEKLCSNCDQSFLGKRQETRCHLCKDQPVIKDWRREQRDIVCRQCDLVMGTETKSITRTNTSGFGLCQECRSYNRKVTSHRMIENNPMKQAETVEKVKETKKYKFENDEDFRAKMIAIGKILAENRRGLPSTISDDARQRACERMRSDNPMKNPETVSKVFDYRDYTDFPRGSNHGRWKGNRDRAQSIRTRLYPTWTFENLERAEFKCEECGVSKVRLEVHHESKTFRECLDDVLDGRRLDLLDDAEFELVIRAVIDAHEHITGKVVCVDCHRKIDEHRH